MLGVGTSFAVGTKPQGAVSPSLPKGLEIYSGVGEELARIVKALQAGASQQGEARAFTTTLRMHARQLRQSGNTNILQDLVSTLERHDGLEHAKEIAHGPAMRDRAADEFEKQFGVDVRPLIATVPRPRAENDQASLDAVYRDIGRGLKLPDVLEGLADTIDQHAGKLSGMRAVQFPSDPGNPGYCGSWCYNLSVIGHIATIICAIVPFLGEPISITGCAAAVAEYYIMAAFLSLIGCDCD